MDAFSERRLEAAILDVLRGGAWRDDTLGLVRVEPGRWVRPRTVALALAAQGFGPLETLDRHVLPMLELLEVAGRVEHLAAVGPSRGRTYWRLVVLPVATCAEPQGRMLTEVTSP